MILQRNRKMYCPLCRRIKLVGIINPPHPYIYARTDQPCMYFVQFFWNILSKAVRCSWKLLQLKWFLLALSRFFYVVHVQVYSDCLAISRSLFVCISGLRRVMSSARQHIPEVLVWGPPLACSDTRGRTPEDIRNCLAGYFSYLLHRWRELNLKQGPAL